MRWYSNQLLSHPAVLCAVCVWCVSVESIHQSVSRYVAGATSPLAAGAAAAEAAHLSMVIRALERQLDLTSVATCAVSSYVDPSCLKLDCRPSLNLSIVGDRRRTVCCRPWINAAVPTIYQHLPDPHTGTERDVMISYNEQSIYPTCWGPCERLKPISATNNKSTCPLCVDSAGTQWCADNAFAHIIEISMRAAFVWNLPRRTAASLSLDFLW